MTKERKREDISNSKWIGICRGRSSDGDLIDTTRRAKVTGDTLKFVAETTNLFK